MPVLGQIALETWFEALAIFRGVVGVCRQPGIKVLGPACTHMCPSHVIPEKELLPPVPRGEASPACRAWIMVFLERARRYDSLQRKLPIGRGMEGDPCSVSPASLLLKQRVRGAGRHV